MTETNRAAPDVPTAPASAWAVALVPSLVAVVVAVLAIGAADLPEQIASHFGANGQPDGSAPPALLWGMVLVGALGLLPTVGALLRVPDRSSAPPALALGTWWTVFFSSLVVWMAVANDGIADWREAEPLAGIGGVAVLVGVVVGPMILAGLAATWLRGLLPEKPRPTRSERDELPTLGLAQGEVATWSQSVSFGWLAVVTLAMAVLGVVLAVAVDGVVGWILVLTAVPVALLMTRFRVQAGAEGLTVRFGWLGWPRQRIPLDEVERALVEPDLKPLEWGGWGYRGSLAIAGRAAVVHRRGPAIVVELTEGRRFAVTCDDPATGAGLLNDLRARVAQSA